MVRNLCHRRQKLDIWKRGSKYLLLVVYRVIQFTRRLRKLWLAAVLTIYNRVLCSKNGVLPFNVNCLKKE